MFLLYSIVYLATPFVSGGNGEQTLILDFSELWEKEKQLL